MSNVVNKLDVFFEQNIDVNDFSQIMRRFMHASLMLNFKDEDGTFSKSIEEGYSKLTDLLEEIDPILHKSE